MTRSRTWRLSASVSPLALAVGVLLSVPALADPTGGSIVQASDAAANSIGGGAGAVVITQGSDRIAINWESFSIANGESVTFNQPDNQSIALNRVIGSGGTIPQSVIDGVMSSNGQVWLLNPSGIAFTSNANVDVGGLLATSADMDPATFIGLDPTTDTYAFTAGAGTVSNAGDLDSVGLMALVAPLVTNSGDLTSSHGDVLLGGAEAYRLKFVSTARNNGAAFDELLVTDFIIDTGSSAAGTGGDIVHQTSTGRSIGGRVIADASRVGGGAFLNMEGLVEAQDVGTLSGDVMLLGGVDITAGALGATATDALKTDNMTIVAPGTATALATAVTNGGGAGPLNSGGGGSETANVVLTATTGDITNAGNLKASAGAVTITAANGSIDVGDVEATGAITISGQDIDLTGTNRSVNATSGAVSLTATGGGANNISSSGVIDIDGDSVVLSGTTTGTSIDVDADNGTVTANTVIATAGSASIDATGNVNVDEVTATTTARVVSSAGAVDVGNVTGPGGITISGTDIDLTGTGGSVQSSSGAVAITATGGGASNISAAGAIDIDGDSVALSGVTTGTSIDIDADAGTVTANNVTATAGSASIDATGDIDVDNVSATTTVRVVSSAGAVDVGNVTGPGGVTLSGTDIDLTGAGGVLSATGGLLSVTASAGNTSAAGAISLTGNSIALTGPVVAGGVATLTSTTGTTSTTAVDITGTSVTTNGNVSGQTGVSLTATTGNVAANAGLSSASGPVVVLALNGDFDGTSAAGISGATGVSVTAQDIDLTGAVNGGTGTASLTATAGDISTPGLLDIDAGTIVLNGTVQAGTGIDLDASAGGITASGGNMTATAGTADLTATGTVDIQGITAPGNISVTGAIVNFAGTLASQADIFLTAVTGALTGSGTSAVTAPGGNLTARALGGAMTLNDVTIGGNLSAIGGSVTMTGTSTTGGSASLQALNGNVAIAGALNALGGVMLLEAPAGTAIINEIASSTDITLTVLDLDLTGTITAGDQFNLTSAGTGKTIIFGGSGGTDGVTLRRPQGFTLDAGELTRIIAAKLQFDGGNNDVALLDATFDPASLQSLVLGADSNARILAAGDVRGLPSLQLGFVDGAIQARPDIVFVSGSLGADSAGDRLQMVRIESARDIVIGTQKFLDTYELANGNLDLATLGEPNLGAFGGTRDHVFIAADQLRLYAPEEIVQLNTGTSLVGAGVVFGEATRGEATIEKAGAGPERVNLFGVVIDAAGQRVSSFEAGLEPNLIETGLTQNGELRLNLCVIGDSSSCSIAILREAQESARSRNSALSSLTNNVFFGFEDDEDDDDDEDDLGGVAGAGNEGLWGVGLP